MEPDDLSSPELTVVKDGIKEETLPADKGGERMVKGCGGQGGAGKKQVTIHVRV